MVGGINKSKIKFTIPGFYYKKEEIAFFVHNMISNPEIVKENVLINSVYGNLGLMIWNGGRPLFRKRPSFTELKELVDFYNDHNIGVNLTCTNSLISDEHLDDWYCNKVLTLCHRKENGIIINSPVLAAYIKKKYPLFKIIGSVTMNLMDIESNNRNLSCYDIVVISPELNRNKEFIGKLNFEEKQRIEVLVNEECPEFCSSRSEHFKLMSETQLAFFNDVSREKYDKCPRLKSAKHLIKRPMYLSNSEVAELADDGFGFFKIQGRTAPTWEYYGFLANYMIKKEYQPQLLEELVKRNKL